MADGSSKYGHKINAGSCTTCCRGSLAVKVTSSLGWRAMCLSLGRGRLILQGKGGTFYLLRLKRPPIGVVRKGKREERCSLRCYPRHLTVD
ncbi:hypothetical protein TNCV_2872891 [Trichonephila clavipes]|nr:hypothetical protein TNCV_2872891 [Trichonephila clavipes]